MRRHAEAARRAVAWTICAAAFLPFAACRTAAPAGPVVAAPPPAPVHTLDEKMSAILRLEDQRWLDDGAGWSVTTLVTDTDDRVRRRAALAIGRVGLPAGSAALIPALTDPDPLVRSNAAFALGLLRAKDAVDSLVTALADADPYVKARAADALALIGEPTGTATPPAWTPAAAIADASGGCAAAIAPLAPDDQGPPASPEIEACRAAILALARLRQFDALSKVVLDAKNHPVSSWWPVAYALQRVRDKRAAEPLTLLVNVDGPSTAAFALRGLADYGDRRVVAPARALATRRSADIKVRVAAIDALGRLKDAGSVQALSQVIADPVTPPNVAITAVDALGAIGDPKAFDVLADHFSDRWAPMRAAALAAAARVDRESFLLIASGLGPDQDWSVRAALAGILAPLDADRVRAMLAQLASDSDPRVQAPALTALARVGAPDLDARIVAALDAPDFNVRAAAAGLVGSRKMAGGAEKLATAYERGQSDANAAARGAALEAIARFGADAASATLTAALDDRDWAVRLQAASLLKGLGVADAQPKRPAPLRLPAEYFASPALLRPQYSPHAFVETKYGTIEIELNVVEAPLATQSFVTLARKGYFNGMRIHRVVPNFVVQAGDDRGDGEGGPGYSLRDELSPLPYVRGTVGMALSGPDTGGSQFFITLSPQPHLEAKYAVFGKVVRGMEYLDLITRWDVIERIRVWDGNSF